LDDLDLLGCYNFEFSRNFAGFHRFGSQAKTAKRDRSIVCDGINCSLLNALIQRLQITLNWYFMAFFC